jgi:hypothetical protein
MPILCYILKYLFYIPPILVDWRRTTSQTRAFAIFETVMAYTKRRAEKKDI